MTDLTPSRRKQIAKDIALKMGVPDGTPYCKQIRSQIHAVLSRTNDEDKVIEQVKASPTWKSREAAARNQNRSKARLAVKKLRTKEERQALIQSWPRDNRYVVWGSIDAVVYSDLLCRTPHIIEHIKRIDDDFAANVANAIEAVGIFKEKTRIAKERADRIAELDRHIQGDEGRDYVQRHIPRDRMDEFRRWFVRKYSRDTSLLTRGVDEFLALDSTPFAKHDQHIQDKILIAEEGSGEGVQEFRSMSQAMKGLNIGRECDAQAFRKDVKREGFDIWEANGKRYLAMLDNDRNRRLAALFADAEDMPAQREGKPVLVLSRPDQKKFADAVFDNCDGACVVTGARLRVRGSAAHLLEHCNEGPAIVTNGLWMRWDIHKVFDKGLCAIDADMRLWFLDEVLDIDPDLAAYQGTTLRPTRLPVNHDYLATRWAAFLRLRGL